MRMLRRIIDDGFCGGPLAAVIGVLLAMQALIGGFGSGVMALASPMEMVICSADAAGQHAAHEHGAAAASHDGSHDHSPPPADGPHSGHNRDCCLTACQINASVHIGIPAKAPWPQGFYAVRLVQLVAIRTVFVPPAHLGSGHNARGPPLFFPV